MPRKKATSTTTEAPLIAATELPITIRKPRPGEAFLRTGNMYAEYCLKVQELADHRIVVGHQYCPLRGPVRRAWGVSAMPTVFHEVLSISGERFAFPQVVTRDPLLPKSWHRCERKALSHDLSMWTSISYCELRAGYQVDIHHLDTPNCDSFLDFDHYIAIALEPYVINDFDHPIIQRLRLIFGDLEDDAVPMEWQHIA